MWEIWEGLRNGAKGSMRSDSSEKQTGQSLHSSKKGAFAEVEEKRYSLWEIRCLMHRERVHGFYYALSSGSLRENFALPVGDQIDGGMDGG